jgi:hypothetical protein
MEARSLSNQHVMELAMDGGFRDASFIDPAIDLTRVEFA